MVKDLLNAKISTIEVINAIIFSLRKILSKSQSSNIEYIIELGLLNKIEELFSYDIPELRNNILWCMINFTAGSNNAVESIIKSNIHRKLMVILDSINNEYLENVNFN